MKRADLWRESLVVLGCYQDTGNAQQLQRAGGDLLDAQETVHKHDRQVESGVQQFKVHLQRYITNSALNYNPLIADIT